MKFYELKLEGDNLKAIPYELIDANMSNITDGFDIKIFKDKRIFQFFKKIKDDEYEPAWGQDLWNVGGRIILPLNDIESLSSDTPIDKFSWDTDLDVCAPNHIIILEED